MKFCLSCKRLLTRKTDTGYVKLICECGNTYDGTPEDTLIMSSFKDETFDFQNVIKFAPHDRVNKIVSEHCPNCTRVYMKRIQVNINTFYVCDNRECNTVLDGNKNIVEIN